MNPEYIIAALGDGSYSVTKFTGADIPDTEYTVKKGKKGWQCDCPSYRFSGKGTCKHIFKVEAFIKENAS